jgi:hypothetical protein
MTDQATKTQANPRDAIRAARQERFRLVSPVAPTIKVWPADEDMRRTLRFPTKSGSIRFRATVDQPVEWPANASFTTRRIADGSVRTDGPATKHPGLMFDPSLNPRQHAAARAAGSAIVAKEKLRLASLSPNTAVSGSDDFEMSCIGAGFTPDTVIKFGGHDEPTKFVSATEVTTGVKPSLFAPAVVPVLVHTGDVSSEALDFTFTAPQARSSHHSKHA